MADVKFTGKIAVVGAGNVGATVAYSILMSKLCSDLVIIDVAKDKACGEALDMKHATAFIAPIRVVDADYSEVADADIIVVTAGVGRKPGQTRIDLAKINVSIARSIMAEIKKYNSDPTIVVISNPVDIITYLMVTEGGFDRNKVFGSGTCLDTARLRTTIADQLKLDARDVNAFMIAEHGDSQVPAWSSANVGGYPIIEMLKESGSDTDEIFKRVRDGGAEIIAKKGATFYGIGSCAARICTAILHDERCVLPLSRVMKGEMGVNDVAISMPYVVGKAGIIKMVEIPLSKAEKEAFTVSAEKMKAVIAEVR